MDGGRDRSPLPVWDAGQYGRFRSERDRPFHDLMARVGAVTARRIADIGCGDGHLTRVLRERWPGAEIWGIDTSSEMLSRAFRGHSDPSLHFMQADLRDWRPSAPVDLIVSNAVLHWVADHAALLRTFVSWLTAEGAIAIQIPNNRSEPAYLAIGALARESPWAERLSGVDTEVVVESPAFYLDQLATLGLDTDLWETIYYHRLARTAEIVEWLKGTTLRPLLSALDAEAGEQFLAELNARVAPLYPEGPRGVLFPFRRLFFVATRIRAAMP
jgi:trans-aconitate 2-methyltransferase